jgi:hypothetical protein
MARLKSFSQRTFAARVFIPIWGKPEQTQNQGGIAFIKPPKVQKNDDDEVILLTISAFLQMVAQDYGS